MLVTKRKPATIGEILNEEFIAPFGVSQGAVADAMGVPRKHVNELCNDRRKVTARTALILARVFGNSAEFWLNVQRRTDLWEAMNSATDKARVERARPLSGAARSLTRVPPTRPTKSRRTPAATSRVRSRRRRAPPDRLRC